MVPVPGKPAMAPSVLPWLEAPLRQALAHNQGHALLIHGPRGVGQFELARALAAAWLCEQGQAAAGATDPATPRRPACGHCRSCQMIAARTHPDLQLLVPEALQVTLGWSGSDDAADGEGGKSKAKPSRDIRIEAVRRAIAFSQQTSSRGGDKVIVMYPAERMNAASASALLKTLEEPPGTARLILASAAPQRLLPTVRSRCQSLRLPVPDTAAAAAWLAGQGGAEPERLLSAAGGQPLEALERLALGIDASLWRQLPAEVVAGRCAVLAAWPLPLAIDALQKLCHDALCVAHGAAPRYFAAETVPRGADPAQLWDCGRELLAAARHGEHPWNAALAVEALVQRLGRALHPVSARPAASGSTDSLRQSQDDRSDRLAGPRSGRLSTPHPIG
jgi:DNA polymerase-3 subunit delta'